MFSTRSCLLIISCACFMVSSTSATDCPSLWTRFNKQCYRYFGYRMSWHDAESYCNNFSPPSNTENNQIAHLVAVNSFDEQNFMYKYWESSRESSNSVSNLMWVGFYKPTGTNYFQWSNRDDVVYTNWDTNRPNNIGGNEDCVEMWEGQGQLDPHKIKSWNDRPCEHKMSFMCEMKMWSFTKGWL